MARVVYPPNDPTPLDERWVWKFPLPGALLASFDAEPEDVSERVQDFLAGQGYSLDGGSPVIAFVRTPTGVEVWARVSQTADADDPEPVVAGATIPKTTEQLAYEALRDRLTAYLDNASPTAAQTVTAVKDLVRVVRRLVKGA